MTRHYIQTQMTHLPNKQTIQPKLTQTHVLFWPSPPQLLTLPPNTPTWALASCQTPRQLPSSLSNFQFNTPRRYSSKLLIPNMQKPYHSTSPHSHYRTKVIWTHDIENITSENTKINLPVPLCQNVAFPFLAKKVSVRMPRPAPGLTYFSQCRPNSPRACVNTTTHPVTDRVKRTTNVISFASTLHFQQNPSLCKFGIYHFEIFQTLPNTTFIATWPQFLSYYFNKLSQAYGYLA